MLLVDDDPGVRKIFTRLVRSLGVRVLYAEDGAAAAIHLARTEAPDLIVLDLGLPRPDGYEVVSILSRELSQRTPLLVYTGRELTAEDRKALKLGETRYLTKTRASEELLVQTVRELLGQAKERVG